MNEDVKICPVCKREFFRKQSRETWKNRVCCSHRCAGALKSKIDLQGMTWRMWADRAGIGVRSLQRRMKKGMTLEEAASIPVHQHAEHCQVHVTIRGETHILKFWFKKFGIRSSTYYVRTRSMLWSPERALTTPVTTRGEEISRRMKEDREMSLKLGGNKNLIQRRRSSRKRGLMNWSEDEIVKTRKLTHKECQIRNKNIQRINCLRHLGIVI